MSYADNKCPCGLKKETETMLCDACVDAFINRAELQAYQDERFDLDFRRNAAFILIGLSRTRRKGRVHQTYRVSSRSAH